MSNFTSKVKGAVDKATSAARDMAQEATNMGDKSMDTQQYDDGSCKVTPEAMPTHKQYGEGHDEQIDKKYDEQYDKESKDQYDPVSQVNMSPLSQETQVSSRCLSAKKKCHRLMKYQTNDGAWTEARRKHGEGDHGLHRQGADAGQQCPRGHEQVRYAT